MALLRKTCLWQSTAIAVLGAIMLPHVLAQAPGKWTRGEPMPSSRSEVAVAAVEEIGRAHV